MSLMKEINEIASSSKDLRKFGLTMGIAFGLIAGWLAWRGHDAVWPTFAGASAFFFVSSLLFPTALKPVQKIWMTLALLMGLVMSRVILVIIFFVAFTPIGLILRLTGKDLLDIRPGASPGSHWKTRKPRQKEDYENQF